MNRHQSNRIESISLGYMKEELGINSNCPRKNCTANLIDVYIRYERGGPVLIEKECTYCGKVVRTQAQEKYLSDLKERKRRKRHARRS